MTVEPLDPSAGEPHKAALDTRIGVGVLVVRDAQVLLGRRIGRHGAGDWAPPGGHLEANESVEACAARELHEETGLVLHEAHAGSYSVNDFPAIGRRYVTLFVIATNVSGTPVAAEPEVCAAWQWFAWNALPTPLFAPFASIVAAGFTPPV
jgi:8-oxo-dGTP diphosphatase